MLPTYSLIKVVDVKNDAYILENGGVRSVIAVSGINFSLLSEKEQNVVISQFKSFLDSLDFPLQIFVISRLENIDYYLKVLHLRLETEKDPLIKFQLEEYINFLEAYLEKHNIFKKLFFIVVPYDPPEANVSNIPFLKRKSTDENLNYKLEQLENRTAYVIQSLAEIGLEPIRLTNAELIALLSETYNPNLKFGLIPKEILEKLTEYL